MERSADSEMMHLKSICNLLHRIITGLICLLHAVLQDQTQYCSDSALDGVFLLLITLILFSLFFLSEQY